MTDANVFGKMFAPVENDFLIGVRACILCLQQKYGITQTSIAQRIGVDRSTINNAQEMRFGLKGWAVFRLIFEFAELAPDAVLPILALGGPAMVQSRDDSKAATALREIWKIADAAGAGEVA